MNSIEIRQVDPAGPEAAELIQALDAELNEHYPKEQIHGIDVSEFKAADGFFVIAFINNETVGCASFRPLDKKTAELKRMFVRKKIRRQGIARKLLEFIEQSAQKRDFERLCLETGAKQPEAISLYQSAGYYEIPVFGEYKNDPASICFEKQLVSL